MGWTQELRELERKTIKLLLEENNYYERMKLDYEKSNKEAIISEIMNCYQESFNCYYSIYAIMDSIEEYMEQHNEPSIIEAINSNEFMVKEW